MTWTECYKRVEPYIQRIDGYAAVTHEDAQQLLGAERFDRLTRDPIRRAAPADGFVYPWNVADYLHRPDLRRSS